MGFIHYRRPLALSAVLATTIGVALSAAGCGVQHGAASSSPSPSNRTGESDQHGAAPVGAVVSASASPSAAAAASPSATPNGTAGTALTISDGTDEVLMNGTAVDFGVPVNDLSWSADGSKAVFIDGQGDLDMADPDGSGRVTLAQNPGGQTWSHPTWASFAGTSPNDTDAWTDVFFAVQSGGTQTLEAIPTNAVDGTPTPVPLGGAFGSTVAVPQTGNSWPTAVGANGLAVFENVADGVDTVFRIDNNIRDITHPTSEVGAEPSVDADNAIVFVRQVGGHSHLFTVSQTGGVYGAPVDITPSSTTDCTEPAWSPDGSLIAFSSPDGVETIHADGTDPAMITFAAGFPAFRP